MWSQAVHEGHVLILVRLRVRTLCILVMPSIYRKKELVKRFHREELSTPGSIYIYKSSKLSLAEKYAKELQENTASESNYAIRAIFVQIISNKLTSDLIHIITLLSH